MSDAPIAEVEFLRKLQRLLNEGDFVATYKLALLNALADLSLEGTVDADGSLWVPLDAIAEKFIEYYWPQARPYRALDGEGFVLRQNTGQQASVITTLVRVQSAHSTVAAARSSPRWRAHVRKVAATVETMPLWKLQHVGSEADEFLYRRAEYTASAISLLPGVPSAFRMLYGLVLDAIRGAWIRQINAIGANRPVLGESDLSSFLFGSERASLERFARVLREHQRAQCLYCRGAITSAGDVDHFVAWSRYPVDLGHNLVLAHRGCNAKKRHFLAHPTHLESWRRSHLERADELTARLDAAKLAHDAERTRAVVWWAYEQGEAAGAHAWVRGEQLERLDGRWRETLTMPALARVAEPPPPEFHP